MALWSSLSNIGSIHLANRAAPATGPILAERGAGVQIDARSQVASPPSEGRRSLVDIVARQSEPSVCGGNRWLTLCTGGAGSSHSTAQAASKRSLQSALALYVSFTLCSIYVQNSTARGGCGRESLAMRTTMVRRIASSIRLG